VSVFRHRRLAFDVRPDERREAAMADDVRLLGSLRRYARTMAGEYDLSDVLYQLSNDAVEVLGVAGAGVAVADDHGHLRYAAASGADVAVLERSQEEHQAGPCVDAYRTRRRVIVEDIASRSDWPEYRADALRLGLHSVAGIPFILRGERLGAINLYDREVRTWADDDLEGAAVIADMAAGTMTRERLEDAHRLACQLQQALDSRVLIEQAKGILSAELALSVDEAFDLLRQHARNSNATLPTVAEAVIGGFRPDV
jgi:GAF domain-containing protein